MSATFTAKPEVHPADAIATAPNLRAALYLILAAIELEAAAMGELDAELDADLAARRDAAARCLAELDATSIEARADLPAAWAMFGDEYVRAIGRAGETEDFAPLAF